MVFISNKNFDDPGDFSPAIWSTMIPGIKQRCAIMSLSFARDGDYLISVGMDSTVRVWNVAQGACVSQFVGHTGPVFASDFVSPKLTTLVSGSQDK